MTRPTASGVVPVAVTWSGPVTVASMPRRGEFGAEAVGVGRADDDG